MQVCVEKWKNRIFSQKFLSYFKINNQKYNYTTQFNNLIVNEKWKFTTSILEFCSQMGIKIPHYCYHKDLSIAGNCRMCLIELKQLNKPIISCSMNAKTTLLPNTEIYTNTPLVKKARENVLEFLLLNHPLDCPICDQASECDLQDQSLFFGFTKKRFYNYKKIVTDKNISPIIKTVMTRCIHCTKCIRFATEIAGVSHLGMFGRSFNAEIGTYISKTFQSEISGNIIDLCPVGALTSKFYPYNNRSWELKSMNSIDFSDGFASEITLQIKNKKIIKIHSNFNQNKAEWISNKTRFSFDGLFPSSSYIKIRDINKIWVGLFKKLIKLFYFYDHLSKHNFEIKPLNLIFGDTLSNESMNLLLFFSKRHKFMKIKRNNLINNDLDLENYFKLNDSIFSLDFKLSKFCLLIGVNPRYEGFYLNLKLRQKQLKEQFEVFSMNSLVNLTYSAKTISTNPKFLKIIAEGNHILCQNFVSTVKPILVINQRISNRIDSNFFFKSIFIIETYSKLKDNAWNGFNLLSTTLNTVGSNNLSVFSGLSNKDFLNSSGLFFFNLSINESSNLKKVLQLKLLNYLKVIIKNYTVDLNFYKTNLFLNKIQNYLYLPTSTFFENSGSFIDTKGIYKASNKIVKVNSEKKNDWEILRVLLSNSKILKLLHTTTKLLFFGWNLNRLKNFIIFLAYASQSISSLSFLHNKKSQTIDYRLFKFQKAKIKGFSTKLKRFIYDFYLANESYYSKFSLVMIQSSNNLRSEITNFGTIFIY